MPSVVRPSTAQQPKPGWTLRKAAFPGQNLCCRQGENLMQQHVERHTGRNHFKIMTVNLNLCYLCIAARTPWLECNVLCAWPQTRTTNSPSQQGGLCTTRASCSVTPSPRSEQLHLACLLLLLLADVTCKQPMFRFLMCRHIEAVGAVGQQAMLQQQVQSAVSQQTTTRVGCIALH